MERRRGGNFVAVPLVVHSLLVGQWKALDFSRALMYVDFVPNTSGRSELDFVVY